MKKELGRETGKHPCKEFPVALHLYWRRSSKRELIWASDGLCRAGHRAKVTSIPCLGLGTISFTFARTSVFKFAKSHVKWLAKKGIYATGSILLVSPPP